MRAVLVDDRRPAVALGEDLQDAGDIGARAAGGELAVAEGAGPAFAEEVIAFGIERPVLIESAYVGDAILDGAAALEDQGSIPVMRQQIAGEQAGGPGADDHGAMSQRIRAGLGPVEMVRDIESRPRASGALERRGEVVFGEIDGGGVGEMNVVVAAGIEALADDPPAQNRIRGIASRLAILSGRLSSGSPSSRRILVTLMGMVRSGSTIDAGAEQAAGLSTQTWILIPESRRSIA